MTAHLVNEAMTWMGKAYAKKIFDKLDESKYYVTGNKGELTQVFLSVAYDNLKPSFLKFFEETGLPITLCFVELGKSILSELKKLRPDNAPYKTLYIDVETHNLTDDKILVCTLRFD